MVARQHSFEKYETKQRERKLLQDRSVTQLYIPSFLDRQTIEMDLRFTDIIKKDTALNYCIVNFFFQDQNIMTLK